MLIVFLLPRMFRIFDVCQVANFVASRQIPAFSRLMRQNLEGSTWRRPDRRQIGYVGRSRALDGVPTSRYLSWRTMITPQNAPSYSFRGGILLVPPLLTHGSNLRSHLSFLGLSGQAEFTNTMRSPAQHGHHASRAAYIQRCMWLCAIQLDEYSRTLEAL
jgi:hypothetical protein